MYQQQNLIQLLSKSQQDTQNLIKSISSELQAVDDNFIYVDKKSQALYHDKLEQLGKVLNKVRLLSFFNKKFQHLKRQFAELHQTAHFDDVGRVYKLIPQNLVEAAIFALKTQLSSATRALPIINSLLSSKEHTLLLLEQGALKILLKYLKDLDKLEIHSLFKLQILETIYNAISHEEFCEKMLADPQESSNKLEATSKGESTPSKRKSKQYFQFYFLQRKSKKNKKDKEKEKDKDKKNKKDKEKDKEKDKKKKKKKQSSRSRSRSADRQKKRSPGKETGQKIELNSQNLLVNQKKFHYIPTQEFDNSKIDQLTGYQIISFVQSRSDDEKISEACFLILRKLQIYKNFRKIKKQISKMEHPNKYNHAEEITFSLLSYIQENLAIHFETENVLLHYPFVQMVTKELLIERMRELAYSIYDAEKNKCSNYQFVKEIIQMNTQSLSQALLVWLNEIGLINILGVLMSYCLSYRESQNKSMRIYQLCLDILNQLLTVKGGVVLLFQDLASIKLIVHSLEHLVTHKELDIQLTQQASNLVNLIKSSAALITLLDHLYIKLLGYDFDCEMVSLLGEVQKYSEMQDEKSQKGKAFELIMRNEFFTDALFYIYGCKNNQELSEREIEVTLLNHIFHNVLRFDDSHHCILLAEKIYQQNRKFIELINKNNYSQSLRMSQLMLTSILDPYELFITKDTTKAIRENFHNRLRFMTINQDPDKNKLIEYFGIQRKQIYLLKHGMMIIEKYLNHQKKSFHSLEHSINLLKTFSSLME